MSDPTLLVGNINRLFLLLFKNGNNDPTRDSFEKYYTPLVETKDFNVAIDNKPFFWSTSQKQRSVRKTYWNVKKWWLYNKKFIWLFVL